MSYHRQVLPLVIAAVSAASVSHADDRAVAQQLFRQGKSLMADGKVAEACPKFEGAAQLSSTAGVRLNLADCWAKLGRASSAWAKYDEALALAERVGDADAADVARKGRAELEPKLSYLTVVVPKQAALAGLEVFRDGQRLPDVAWGMPAPVDPGDHEVIVSAPGHKPWSIRKTVIGEGAKVNLEVPVLEEDKPVLVGAAGPASAAHEAPADIKTMPSMRTIALVAGGLGVVGIGIGSYFGLRANSKKNDYESHLNADGACRDTECQTLSQDAHSAGNVATVGFLAGGVLVATGAVLWFAAPSGGGKVGGAKFMPVAGTHVAGIEMRGAW